MMKKLFCKRKNGKKESLDLRRLHGKQKGIDRFGAVRALQHFDRCVALSPEFGATLQAALATGGIRGEDQAGTDCPAFAHFLAKHPSYKTWMRFTYFNLNK